MELGLFSEEPASISPLDLRRSIEQNFLELERVSLADGLAHSEEVQDLFACNHLIDGELYTRSLMRLGEARVKDLHSLVL